MTQTAVLIPSFESVTHQTPALRDYWIVRRFREPVCFARFANQNKSCVSDRLLSWNSVNHKGIAELVQIYLILSTTKSLLVLYIYIYIYIYIERERERLYTCIDKYFCACAVSYFIIIAFWSWFSHVVLFITGCEHGHPSIATVHFFNIFHDKSYFIQLNTI